MPWQEPIKIDMDDIMGMFHRSPEDRRWANSAESQEYLELIQYLVHRNEQDGRRST